jgi:hypothetical protein
MREMQGFLKMWNYWFWNYVEMCLICYMYGKKVCVYLASHKHEWKLLGMLNVRARPARGSISVPSSHILFLS